MRAGPSLHSPKKSPGRLRPEDMTSAPFGTPCRSHLLSSINARMNGSRQGILPPDDSHDLIAGFEEHCSDKRGESRQKSQQMKASAPKRESNRACDDTESKGKQSDLAASNSSIGRGGPE